MRLSIIIPTLNEAGYLPATVQGVRRRARLMPHEIIVADCGSTDGTRDVARRLGVMVCGKEPVPDSRAAALNCGAADATGDVFLFLDADTLPPRGFDRSIAGALRSPRVVGGAFEFALDGAEWEMRLIEIINRIRYRLWPRYYGDQGIFVRADVFHHMGGYRHQRLMEAAEFSVRLARRGVVVLLRPRMTTSARRFREAGVWRVLAHDTRLWWRDLTHRPVEPFADAYQRENRERGALTSAPFPTNRAASPGPPA